MNRLNVFSTIRPTNPCRLRRHDFRRVNSLESAEELLHGWAQALVCLNEAANKGVTTRGGITLHAAEEGHAWGLVFLGLVDVPNCSRESVRPPVFLPAKVSRDTAREMEA
jgi:hypothetical protein